MRKKEDMHMKKALHRCLTPLLAAVLTFSLCASAFAEEQRASCFHTLVLLQKGITWYDYTASTHTWNRGSLYRCSKCGYEERQSDTSDRAESHSIETTSVYNHELANPAKHNVVITTGCTVCPYVKSKETKLTGCTSAGCRLTQRVDPVLVTA